MSKQEAIFSAALLEFASNGYDTASTNVIAHNAGISKPLLFHYVKSKKELFLTLFDHCESVLKQQYFSRVDTTETDLLERLRQTYLLKVQVIQRHPLVFDFIRKAGEIEADDVRQQMQEKLAALGRAGHDIAFGNINTTLFRPELDANKCRQLIFWAISGYANQKDAEMKQQSTSEVDYEQIRVEFDAYLEQLKAGFYR